MSATHAAVLCQPWVKPKLEKLSPISVDLGDHISLQIVLPDATLAILIKTPYEIMRDIDKIDSEMLALKERSEWAYLIITGEVSCDKANYLIYDRKPTKWSYNAWQGKLATFQEMGVTVLIIEPHALVFVLESLIKRKRGPKRIKPPRETLFQDPSMDLLTSIAGIGEERAAQLINETGSAAMALQALTDLTIKPPFGEKVRAAARAALGLQSTQDFGIVVVDKEVLA